MRSGNVKLVASIKSVLNQPLSTPLLKSLLADVRKLLESTGSSDRYPTLKFHCDWVLHTKMSKRFASELLRRVDTVFDNLTSQGLLIPRAFADDLLYKAGFFGFIKELREFLSTFNIVIVQLENDARWLGLQRLYYDIVEGAFLEYTPKKNQPPLKRINGARIQMFSLAGTPDYPDIRVWYKDQPEAILPFGVEWTFTKNGEDMFKLPLTYMLPSYVDREVKEQALLTPPLPLYAAGNNSRPAKVVRTRASLETPILRGRFSMRAESDPRKQKAFTLWADKDQAWMPPRASVWQQRNCPAPCAGPRQGPQLFYRTQNLIARHSG